MPSPIPRAAIGASHPTSRATFRFIARCLDATNRDADTLRHALLDQWEHHTGADQLAHLLQSLDRADPDGAQGAEARLAIWFTYTDPGDGRLVSSKDPVLAGLSDELCTRLAMTTRPVADD